MRMHGSRRASRPASAALLGLVLAAAQWGCTPVAPVAPAAAVSEASSAKPASVVNAKFAATVEGKRKGLWLGGAPPDNKRQSGIDTYYRLAAGAGPDQLTITMRFEGVTANDALVRFNTVAGARLEPPGQPSEWRLKPNAVSEISLTLALPVPTQASYLNLFTLQNQKGASRAFLLEIPAK